MYIDVFKINKTLLNVEKKTFKFSKLFQSSYYNFFKNIKNLQFPLFLNKKLRKLGNSNNFVIIDHVYI